jgi:dephospho-CoA kinase
MAIIVGITGGIGSGKSTVCRLFEILGAPVFSADTVAKTMLNSDQKLKKGIQSLFGDEIYLPDGNLDRKRLASIIFAHPVSLQQVNELVHPVVRKEFYRWMEKYKQSDYVIHEAAILFESGFYRLMDFTILVSATEEQRISRVMKRDGISEETVRERMRNQWSDDKKAEMADLILKNDNRKFLIPEILNMDYKLKVNGSIC